VGREKKHPQVGKAVIEFDSGSDPEFVQALLGVYRYLELADQFEALLDCAVRWSGAQGGVGLGAVEERRSFVPLAGTFPPEDPRFKAFSPTDPLRLKSWLPDGPQLFNGLGPFSAAAAEWPDRPPARCLALPVLSAEQRWGGVLILLLDADPGADQLARLTGLLEMARPAVGHALQLLSMRELIIKDDTASCFNRRHFEEFLPEELARASRFRAPVSLIFLDMDNLKEVNLHYGHNMGSRTLYEVSVRVRSKIRKFDKLFRFGGDEFCIVLPETEWHGALEVAERVRDSVASKPFLLRELGNDGVKMTASLGIASFPLHARTRKELIERADRAMQRVKSGGKNGIGIAEIEGDDDGE
jgi:diguanylate cyclase (GGDEF)-like protein